MKAVWGVTPETRGQVFEVGDRIGTACGMSLTRMEEERRDGDERNVAPDGLGAKATRVGYTSLIRTQGESTRMEIANKSASCSELDIQMQWLDYAGCVG